MARYAHGAAWYGLTSSSVPRAPPPSLSAQPPPADIDVLVPFNLYHVYVFCTQECLNSIAKSIVFTSKAPWEQKLQDCVGDDYVMLRRCAECRPLRGI
jgi:hypothetical protein